MNRKTVIWVLIILGGLFAVERYFKSLKKEAFETVIISVDTAMVDAMKITAPLEEDPMVFVKTASSWIVSHGNISVKAASPPLKKLLSELVLINVSEIVSDRSGSWVDYGVGEDQGVRIQVFSNQEKLEDFIVGSVKKEEERESSEYYIRLFDQKEIYAVAGQPLLYCTLPIEDFRQKRILYWPENENITQIKLQYPDTVFYFSLENRKWKEKGNRLSLDSIGMPDYFNSLNALSGEDFADDFDETTKEDWFYQSLTFSGNNDLEPLTINCYRDSTREKSFILHSSANPDAWFESDSIGVFYKVFKRLEQMIH